MSCSCDLAGVESSRRVSFSEVSRGLVSGRLCNSVSNMRARGGTKAMHARPTVTAAQGGEEHYFTYQRQRCLQYVWAQVSRVQIPIIWRSCTCSEGISTHSISAARHCTAQRCSATMCVAKRAQIANSTAYLHSGRSFEILLFWHACPCDSRAILLMVAVVVSLSISSGNFVSPVVRPIRCLACIHARILRQ